MYAWSSDVGAACASDRRHALRPLGPSRHRRVEHKTCGPTARRQQSDQSGEHGRRARRRRILRHLVGVQNGRRRLPATVHARPLRRPRMARIAVGQRRPEQVDASGISQRVPRNCWASSGWPGRSSRSTRPTACWSFSAIGSGAATSRWPFRKTPSETIGASSIWTRGTWATGSRRSIRAAGSETACSACSINRWTPRRARSRCWNGTRWVSAASPRPPAQIGPRVARGTVSDCGQKGQSTARIQRLPKPRDCTDARAHLERVQRVGRHADGRRGLLRMATQG